MELRSLEIIRWAHGGDAVAIPEAGPLAGMIVFVKDAVPGERVDVAIIERKKRWARATVIKRRHPSPERVPVACEHHASCGGCPWMAGSQRAQAASRLAILRGEARKRLRWSEDTLDAKVTLASDSGPPLGYRCRLRLAYRVGRDGRAQVGFRAARSHRLVPISACVVAEGPLSAFLSPLRDALSERGEGEGEVSLLSGEEGVGAWVRPMKGEPWGLGPQELTLKLGPRQVLAAPDAFAQANRVVTSEMIEAIARAAGPATTPDAHAVELFAGSGTLSSALLAQGYRVSAYEVARESQPFFERNTAGQAKADFHVCDLLDAGVPLPRPEPAELVLLDPPRQGAHALMPWLREFGAARIIMVSCDVSTALRDLAELDQRYETISLQGWNMFPHTGHQEVIACLERR